MKNTSQTSTVCSRVLWHWAKFRYEIGVSPPPWHDEKMVDTIDLGDRLMADVRVYTNESGNECFLVDLMDKQDNFATLALFHCCDLSTVLSLLGEACVVIERYRKSVPADEWCDD